MPMTKQAPTATKKTPAPQSGHTPNTTSSTHQQAQAQLKGTGGYAQQQAAVKPKPVAPTSKTDTKPATNLGIPGAAGQAQGGLPDTLQTLPSGKRVAHGTDPGDFYCEHMFYSTQVAAQQPGTSILRNEQGESLTGFLHMPGDREATDNASEDYTRKTSQKDAQAVVGSALRGWIDTALPQVSSGPVRMLLTGYANWGSVVNNPTGGFVSAKKNLDAAMAQAFGAQLKTKQGKAVDQGAGTHVFQTWSYRIATATGEREVQLRGQVFPVGDETIDRGAASVQQAIADWAPHGVLSMGVAVGHDDFLAEHHADDGGLDDAHAKHDDAQGPRHNLPDNYALARGIQAGQKARGK